MKTEISNTLILQAHKEACDKWKVIIEKECPELFKPKFKVGDWIVYDAQFYKNLVPNRIKEMKGANGISNYGFHQLDPNYRLATKEEIESHLIKEAEKRGFKDGVNYKCIRYGDLATMTTFQYYPKKDSLTNKFGDVIYCQGKWATIITEPKIIELTLEDIAKKYGVDSVKIVK